MNNIIQGSILIILYIVRMIVMIINFIGYSVIPELKNSHGLAIRCYIVTYIIIAIVNSLTVMILVSLRIENVETTFYTSYIIIIHYCNISSALWLQVISFDIWWTFRNLRCVDHRVRIGRNGKFIWYALYAGVLPIILEIPGVISFRWYYTSLKENSDVDIIYVHLPTYVESAIYATVCLCNIFFYVSMFCTIRRQKKETSALTEGSNHRHGAQKQWFNLYVKLSLIMGIHMIAWLFIPFSRKIPTLQWIYQVSELLHSILMFRLFIWRDSVKQALRERFCSTPSICLRKLCPSESKTIGSPYPDSEPETASSRV